MATEIAIYIGYEQQCDEHIIIDMGLGVEEEGVPYILRRSNNKDARIIAKEMSMLSKLDIGIAYDAQGNICIHHKMFPDAFYLFYVNIKKQKVNLRHVGANSARLTKGIPFKSINE